MTSRPLFINVAESMVILPPIAHVGWLSASSTVTSASSAWLRPRNGPPEAVIVIRSSAPVGTPCSRWCSAACSESTGQDLRARGLGELGDELAADDERLLVGQREVDALPQRRDRRAEAGRADQRVEHEVGAGLEHELDEPLGAGEHLAVRPRLGGAGGGVGVGERDAAHAVADGLFDERLPGARGAQADDLEIIGAGDHVERLGADRPGGAEHEETAGHVPRRVAARTSRPAQSPGRLHSDARSVPLCCVPVWCCRSFAALVLHAALAHRRGAAPPRTSASRRQPDAPRGPARPTASGAAAIAWLR